MKLIRTGRIRPLVAAALLLASGCGNSTVGGEPDANAADASGVDASPDGGISEFPYPIELVTVAWVSCSLYEGAADGRAECAEVDMPRRWDDPGAGTVKIKAKRLLSSTSQPEAQVWFLHGGPGASGTIGLPSMMELTQQGFPEASVYTLDARGTGHSDFLSCPDQEAPLSDSGAWITVAELGDCIAYLQTTHGADLETFSTTHSAIDLAAFIYHTREPGQNVLMWGGSGGTFWAQRFLQIFPDLAQGVVLEGIVPADGSLVIQDEYDDLKIREILQLCTTDAFCSPLLAAPEPQLLALFGLLDGGHCSNLGVSTTELKQILRNMAYYGPFNAMIPAVIHRLQRCDPGDEQAIINLYGALFGGSSAPGSFSTVVFFQQLASELWLTPELSTAADVLSYLDGVYANTILSFGMGYDRHEVYLGWPRYTDSRDNSWASSDVPMLMLQGELDPSTPYDFAIDVGANFSGANQAFVSFPHAAHNVMGATPTSSTANPLDCARQLFLSFLRAPTTSLDTSCVAQVVPMDFEGTLVAPYIMGTINYWDNVSALVSEPPGHDLPTSIREALRRLRLQLRQSRLHSDVHARRDPVVYRNSIHTNLRRFGLSGKGAAESAYRRSADL